MNLREHPFSVLRLHLAPNFLAETRNSQQKGCMLTFVRAARLGSRRWGDFEGFVKATVTRYKDQLAVEFPEVLPQFKAGKL
jgi:hypothetical protein